MKLNIRTIYLLAIAFLSALSVQAIEDEREFRVINAANGLADNSAQIVVCTKTGRMIISTLGNLNFYDGASFTHIDTRHDYHFQLPLYRGGYRLYFDHSHHLWLKDKGVVTCVDLLQEQFIKDVASVVRDGFGCDEIVQDLFADEGGDMWFLTEKGLYGAVQKRAYQVLRDCNLQDIAVKDSLLYTFYDNGEEVGLDLHTGRVVHRTKAYSREEVQDFNSTSYILSHADGYFLLRNGEKKGVLLFFDAKKLEWTKLMEQDYHLNSVSVYNDCLYVASEHGYWILDIKSGEKVHVAELSMSGKSQQLSTSCNTLAFDKQGGMWIGTNQRGLLYARPLRSPFKVYQLDSPIAQKYLSMMEELDEYVGDFKGMQTNCKYKDSRGWTWFGTTMGLYMYRSPQSEPVVYTRATGLLNNVIHSIVEDQHHNIWLSTSCGISCILFEGEKQVFVNSFNVKDNVPNESFLNRRACCLDDGTILMQSIDHMVTFNPDDFDMVNGRKPYQLFPKLVRLLVNGNFVSSGEMIDGNVVIERAITRTKDISLNADQNSISLTFSGLNYFRPIQTFYRIRVKGIQEEAQVLSYYNSKGLVDANGMLHFPLTGLEPGDYEIEVQASMFPDVWANKPYVWIVHVNQPWWQKTGLYLLLGCIILALLVVNFIYYSRNTKMRARLNSEEGDIIRKIVSFVTRCDTYTSSVFKPGRDDNADIMERNRLAPEFIQVMIRIMPYIRQHRSGQLTMRKLSELGGVDVARLFDLMTTQLYKNPRDLARYILLHKAADLLRSTDKSAEEIADECGFYTPNYFFGNFFHEFKMTPREYREENA